MRRIVAFIVSLLLLAAALPAGAEAAPDAAKQIVISFTGDCTLGCDPRERGAATGFEAFIEKYGYEYPFEKVKHIFEADDLTVINLEGVFADSDAGRVEKTYSFRGPTDYAKMLPLAGIEACSIGNNHILDYGPAGQQSTIEALEANGVAWFGTTDGGADGVYIFEKDGVKIGFVSIFISDWWIPGTPTVIKQHMLDMKEQGCSLIIACMHGGVEYDVRHELNQEKLADQLIRYGAEIVIGSHPHSIQGLREQDGVCTLWSLGNFAFGGNSSIVISRKRSPNYGKINLNTFIAQFTLSFDEHNAYLGHQLNIIPCFVSGADPDTEKNNYQPVPVSGRQAEQVLRAIQDDTFPRRLKLNPYVEGVGAVQDFVPAAPRQ